MSFLGLLKKILKVITNRLFVVFLVFFIMFAALVARFFKLQIIDGQKYVDSFALRIEREREIVSTRGNIYDKYGRLLAGNLLAYSVLLDDAFDVPDKNDMIFRLINIIEGNGDSVDYDFAIEYDDNNDLVFVGSNTTVLRFKKDVFGKEELSEKQTNMTAVDMYEYITQRLFEIPEAYSAEETYKIAAIRFRLYQKRFKKYQQDKIATNISEKTLADIRENAEYFPGVTIIEDSIRVYYEAEYFANIIGYTGKITDSIYEELHAQDESYTTSDIVGRSGLEYQYELLLKGTKGNESVLVSNTGKILETTSVIQPIAGKDIYLTIDSELQKMAYHALEEQIAEVLANRIVAPGQPYTSKQIPAEEALMALLNNNIYDINHLYAEDATDIEKMIYTRFKSKLSSIDKYLLEQLNTKEKIVSSLSDENKEYIKYVVTLLTNKGIIDLSTIPDNDSTEKAWENETISLKTYLNYLIANNYIVLSRLDLEGNYHSSNEIYTKLIDYISIKLAEDYNFSKIVYSYMIKNRTVDLKTWCVLLYEQGIIEYDETAVRKVKNGSISVLAFLKENILNLNLPPKSFALDPCSGSATFVDSKTNEVLVMVSYPNYDNNKLVNTVDSEYYNKLLNDKSFPMLNRATQYRVAPGSTFKMLTSTAAIEEGVLKINEKVNALGTFDKIKPAVKCWCVAYGYSHGYIDVVKAHAVSCNYFFCEMGYRLSLLNGVYNEQTGLDRISKYAALYGLNDKSGVEIAEYTPKIATEYPITTAIGQSNNAYTSTQMARYVNTIVNNGNCYEINLVDKINNGDGSLYFDKTPELLHESQFDIKTMETVKKGMYSVTNTKEGTGTKFFKDFEIVVAGKTGTAQEDKKRPDHSVFVGFAPYSNPEIAGAVNISFCGTSATAPLFRKIVAGYYKLYEEPTSQQYKNELQ